MSAFGEVLELADRTDLGDLRAPKRVVVRFRRFLVEEIYAFEDGLVGHDCLTVMLESF